MQNGEINILLDQTRNFNVGFAILGTDTAKLEHLIGNNITRSFGTELVLFNIAHARNRSIRPPIAGTMPLRPRFQLVPTSALAVLPDTGDTIVLEKRGAWGVVGIAEDLSSQGIKAVRDVAPFPALGLAAAIFHHRNAYYFLAKASGARSP